MDLSGRLVLLKSSAKEEDYPTFTPEDVIFLFDEITCPEGVILNLSDPLNAMFFFLQQHKWRIYLILIKNLFWVGGSHVTDSKIDLI